MGIGVLAVDGGVGAVPQHALDHRGDLGGAARPELRVDAHRFPVHMPVDHDAVAAVADVVLGHQVDDHEPNFLESDAQAVPLPHHSGSRSARWR